LRGVEVGVILLLWAGMIPALRSNGKCRFTMKALLLRPVPAYLRAVTHRQEGECPRRL